LNSIVNYRKTWSEASPPPVATTPRALEKRLVGGSSTMISHGFGVAHSRMQAGHCHQHQVPLPFARLDDQQENLMAAVYHVTVTT
jgi:hypothetical protein